MAAVLQLLSDALGFALTPRHLVLAGLAAITAGACGMLSYVGLYVLPPAVSFCGMVMFLGISLLQSQLHVDDPVLLGLSVADAVTAGIDVSKKVFRGWVLLFCLPDLAAEDVALVYRANEAVLLNEKDESKVTAHTGASLLPRRVNNGSTPCTALIRNSHEPIDEFDAAVRWLRRPCLLLNFREQLHLHSLYLQATIGDAGVETVSVPPSVFASASRVLARSKLEGWQAIRGMSRAVARGQLPLALSKVDRSFASTHRRLAPLPAAESQMTTRREVLFQLLERRLPTDLDEQVTRAQRYLFGSSLAATVLFFLRSVLRRMTSRSPRRLELRSILPSAVSLGIAAMANMYLGALACGLPAWLYAFLLRSMHRGDVSVALPSDVRDRLARLVFRMVFPRLARPLLAE